MGFSTSTCTEFVEVLSSKAPVPGGGGASGAVALLFRGKKAVWRHHRRPGGIPGADDRAADSAGVGSLHAGGKYRKIGETGT